MNEFGGGFDAYQQGADYGAQYGGESKQSGYQGGGGYGGGYGAQGGQGSYGGGTNQFSGGFMQNTGGYGASPQQSPPKRMGKTRANSIRPVIVKQLLEAKEDARRIMIDGQEIAQIVVVGQIVEIQKQETNFIYTIDDGTGTIATKVYHEDETAASKLRENLYVSVYGIPGSLQGQNYITGYKLDPVQDKNEITYHFLNVLRTHLVLTQGAPPAAMGGAAPAAAAAATTGGFGANTKDQFGGGMGGGFGTTDFNAVQQRVYQCFRSTPSGESGPHIDEICKKVPDISPQEVRKAVEFLTAEGHLYSTVDDYHYKLTSG